MFSKWTDHLKTEEQKENFKQQIYSAKSVLERQRTVIEEAEEALTKAEISPKNYEIPNWDYRQAHNNGYRQALRLLKDFIDLDKQQVPKETMPNERKQFTGQFGRPTS